MTNKILHYVDIGSGAPLVILHGLFGSHKNWQTVGRELAFTHHVYLLDQRNHGDSFHANTHEINDLIEDLKNWLEHLKLKQIILLGHSMGGLVACGFALQYPEFVSSLIVVDIAPRSYTFGYQKEFEALSLDISKFTSLAEIDQAMEKILESKLLRQFLQMNLNRHEFGFGYYWSVNVPILKNTYTREFSVPNDVDITYPKKTLFIKGGQSNFIQEQDIPLIKKYFPKSTIEIIPKGDHWLHHSQYEAFVRVVKDFIESHSLIF